MRKKSVRASVIGLVPPRDMGRLTNLKPRSTISFDFPVSPAATLTSRPALRAPIARGRRWERKNQSELTTKSSRLRRFIGSGASGIVVRRVSIQLKPCLQHQRSEEHTSELQSHVNLV